MKNFLVAALLVLITSRTLAQDDSGIRFGLTLSPQISWMNAGDKNLESNGAYFGFAYGLLMDVLIPKNYAFATGILLSYGGGKLTYEDPTKFNSFPDDTTFAALTNVDYRIQYIEIPLTMKLRTNQIGYMTYFGQFGLQGGVKIRARADINNLVTSDSKIDFGKDVTPGDLGLLLGAGFEYAFSGNTAAHVSLQFYNGFLDATDNPQDYKTKSTLNHVRLQLGVFF